jgi:hypothetical protein
VNSESEFFHSAFASYGRILITIVETDRTGSKFSNLVTRESNCRRITNRLWRGRYSLSWDSSKANTRRGVFRVKLGPLFALSRNGESRPSLWGEWHEGSHQKGGLGSARANPGGDGNARHRQRRLLLAVTVIASSEGEKAIELDCFAEPVIGCAYVRPVGLQ